MKWPIFKSEIATWIKVFGILIFWCAKWLYAHQKDSNDLISDTEEEGYGDEEKEKEAYEVGNQRVPPTASMPMSRQVPCTKPQATPLPQVAVAHAKVQARPLLQGGAEPSQSFSPTSKVANHRKTSLVDKRKLFRNALLMDALMRRKKFV